MTETTMPDKALIVCADDFAVNTSASLGIARLAQLGRISATSVMALSPRWAQDAALLRELRGQLDVGLHLDWTSEFAVAAGHGLSLGAAMRRALLGGFAPLPASVVIERQLDLFEAHWQAPPDYVDGHQHVHQFAGIREALVAALQRRYGSARHQPYLRLARPPSGLADLKSRIIAAMGAQPLQALADRAGLPYAPALTGVYDFKATAQRFAELMARWLARSPGGTIVMCHPAQAAEPGDEIGSARVQEYSYLAGSDYTAALHQARVRVARWRDLGPAIESSRHETSD